MALVVFSGFPSSGKTVRAKQLQRYLEGRIRTEELELEREDGGSGPQFSKPSSSFSKGNKGKGKDSSGRSGLAGWKVEIINDESLSIGKHAYDASSTEKPARAKQLSTVIRALSSRNEPGPGSESGSGRKSSTSTADGSGKKSQSSGSGRKVIILDGMNYIKGFRYQLYCAAREVGARYCMIHIATPQNLCQQWNQTGQLPEQKYKDSTLENLLTRFEEPSPFVRWDSPLFVIPWDDPPFPLPNPAPVTNLLPAAAGSTGPLQSEENSINREAGNDSNDERAEQEGEQKSDNAMKESVNSEEKQNQNQKEEKVDCGFPFGDKIWEAITRGEVKPPNIATVSTPVSSTNYLTILESTTSSLISSLLTYQSETPGGISNGKVVLALPLSNSAAAGGRGGNPMTMIELNLSSSSSKILTTPYLQRLRRQFIGLNKKSQGQVPGEEMNEVVIARIFGRWLEDRI